MFFSRESTKVSTDMMAKIPTVTPSNDNTVRRRLDFNAAPANRKLSRICLNTFMDTPNVKFNGWLVGHCLTKLRLLD